MRVLPSATVLYLTDAGYCGGHLSVPAPSVCTNNQQRQEGLSQGCRQNKQGNIKLNPQFFIEEKVGAVPHLGTSRGASFSLFSLNKKPFKIVFFFSVRAFHESMEW
jgi:hypothetical protein